MSEFEGVTTESNISDVARDYPGWVCLAALDASEAYEVDYTEVWRSPDGRIQLVTASGCSCWGGEYSVQDGGFESVDALHKWLDENDTDSGYNPSVKGRALMAKAQAAVAIPIRNRSKVTDEDIAAVEELLGKNPVGWN